MEKEENLPSNIAIFPLSNAIFFPGTILPLNIFENRYLQLVGDCMKEKRMFGMVQPKNRLTENPEVYFPLIEKHNIEYVTFQYENVNGFLNIPDTISSKLGLAITSDTDVAVFDKYKNRFSFILFMATTPGKSAGVFNKLNFQKIRKFRSLYPDKNIHVDGGVDGEVSFILRNKATSNKFSELIVI